MRRSLALVMVCLGLVPLLAGPVGATPSADEEPPAEEAPPTTLDEIVVTASYSLLRDEPVTVVDLDREQIMELPHFGDDLFRAVSILPGVSSQDFSARFNIRGGPHEELLVRLDGLELFEPFHLEDLEGVFNILDPEIIGAVDLIPGSYPVEYGDRMSGVVDLTTSRPSELRTNVGISFSNVWAGGSGSFAEDRGRWLGSARRGYLDLIMSFVGEDQGKGGDDEWSPRYWDVFTKLDYDLTPSQSGSLKLLRADDSLTINQVDGAEVTDLGTAYGNSTLGSSHRAILGANDRWSRACSRWPASIAIARSRWSERDEHLADARRPRPRCPRSAPGLEHCRLRAAHFLKGGFEVRSCDVDYDYFNEIVDDNFIDDPRFPPPTRTTRFWGRKRRAVRALGRRSPAAGQAPDRRARRPLRRADADRGQPGQPAAQPGLRAGRAGLVRAGWGHFYQSQRAHELDVEFGETGFHPAQRAEQLNLGFEKRWPRSHRLRVDAYRREVSDPLPRYETLFNTVEPVPGDRARPDSHRGRPSAGRGGRGLPAGPGREASSGG